MVQKIKQELEEKQKKPANEKEDQEIADTVCHGTEGGLMILIFLRTWIRRKPWLWILVGLGVFFGTLPDLIGAYGNVIEHDHWTLYRNAHFGAIKDVLQYVPMYSLHLYLDTLMHGPGHRWWRWDERLWLEVLLWIVNLVIIGWMVKSWKKNADKIPEFEIKEILFRDH